jgi:hypothetical protein
MRGSDMKLGKEVETIRCSDCNKLCNINHMYTMPSGDILCSSCYGVTPEDEMLELKERISNLEKLAKEHGWF